MQRFWLVYKQGDHDHSSAIQNTYITQDLKFIPFCVKVATSLWEPHIVGMGEVWNPHHGFCLDQQDGAANVGLPLLVFDCHGEKGNQYWYYRSDGTLGHDLLCVVERQGAAGESPLVLGPCRSESSISLRSNTLSDRGADRWQYEARSGLMRHISTQKCLAVTRCYITFVSSRGLLLMSGSLCSCGCFPVRGQTLSRSGISPIIR